MKGIHIRPIEENDFEEFVRLRSEALKTAPESFGSDYEHYNNLSPFDKEHAFSRLLNYPFNFALGAFDNENRILGLAGFSSRHYNKKQRHKGYLWGIYVSESCRGKGIATQLVETMFEIAREETFCEHIRLTVASDNEQAISLYTNLGFIKYGTEHRALKLDENTYIDEILLMRNL